MAMKKWDHNFEGHRNSGNTSKNPLDRKLDCRSEKYEAYSAMVMWPNTLKV